MHPIDKPVPGLLDDVLAAHGGRGRWQAVNRIEAAFSSGGLAFASHLQPFALRGLRITVYPHLRRVVLHDYCRQGWSGIWTPSHVEIKDQRGAVVAERYNPRQYFSRLGRKFRWDKLDLLYFAGYAMWNYLSFPFILESPGVRVAESPPDGGTNSRRLVACFDDDFPTHSKIQTFHVDASGRLLRHDYTADVIGRWATAANCCLASECVDGLRIYTRRRVLPHFGNRWVLPGPTLVWINIDDVRVA